VIRLAIRCSTDDADLVLAELLDLAPNGVEEDRDGGHVEYAIYGAPGELPVLPDLEALAGPGRVTVTTTEVPDDWADRWRDFHEPVLIGERIWVRPSWADAAEAGALDVVIDPGQAFGTGAHPTTRMCVELMLNLSANGLARGSLADLGTGSAVLAIAAARLGWDPVVAVDRERAALEAAATNARLNGVTLDLRRGDVRETAAPSVDTLVANLTAPLLRAVAERLDSQPRQVVCSGLLAPEAAGVIDAFAEGGLREVTRQRSGEWTALLLGRP
jgi:ribosomal protein L11 methyltransferase